MFLRSVVPARHACHRLQHREQLRPAAEGACEAVAGPHHARDRPLIADDHLELQDNPAVCTHTPNRPPMAPYAASRYPPRQFAPPHHGTVGRLTRKRRRPPHDGTVGRLTTAPSAAPPRHRRPPHPQAPSAAPPRHRRPPHPQAPSARRLTTTLTATSTTSTTAFTSLRPLLSTKISRLSMSWKSRVVYGTVISTTTNVPLLSWKLRACMRLWHVFLGGHGPGSRWRRGRWRIWPRPVGPLAHLAPRRGRLSAAGVLPVGMEGG